MPAALTRLTVIYDDRCMLCIRIANRLVNERCWIPLVFRTRRDSRIPRSIYPIMQDHPDELIAYGDDGSVYLDTNAYLIILWATRRYRPWSLRLASPALRPLTRQACHHLTENRTTLSQLLQILPRTRTISPSDPLTDSPSCPSGKCSPLPDP